MHDSLRLIRLIFAYLLASISSIAIYFLNLDFVKSNSGNALTQLGAGLSKVIIIPLYIILYLVAISFTIRSIILSLSLLKTNSKMIKALSIIIFLLTLALTVFVGITIKQTISIF